MEVGEVFVIPYFPHQENRSLGEPRWVIYIEDLEQFISIVPMTSQTHQKGNYKKCIEVKKDSEDGKEMGLEYDSIIMCEREIQFPKKYLKVIAKKGNCPEELLSIILDLVLKK